MTKRYDDMTSTERRSHGQKQAAKRRAERKMVDAYCAKFGPLGMILSAKNIAAVAKSLRTGEDQPVLLGLREEQAENDRTWPQRQVQMQAEREAYDKAHPFTFDDEAEITKLVQKRRLYEGACDLRWQDYFAFREAHEFECRQLTNDDVRYLSQWTSCALKREAV